MTRFWKIFIWFSGVVTIFIVLLGVNFVNFISSKADNTTDVVQLNILEPEEASKRLEEIRKSRDKSKEDSENSKTSELEKETKSVSKEMSVTEKTKKLNLLALGVDTRGNSISGRTDAIVVISLDRENSTMELVSIPRDSYVEILPTGKKDKINHAFAFGGVDYTVSTVENLLNIEIDYYGVINFRNFEKLVDVLGGIEVDVPFSFSEQDASGRRNAVRFEKGLQTLNGEQALAYARMRKQDPTGDIGRGERQQQVIKAMFDRLLSFSTLTKVTEIYEIMKEGVQTNVGFTDIMKLAPYLAKYENVNSHTLTGGGMNLNGVYYYQLDSENLENVKERLK